MWTVEQLEKKIADLSVQIEQSAANHHVLVGGRLQLQGLLTEVKNATQVVAAAEPALAQDCSKIEQVVDAVETVIEAVN